MTIKYETAKYYPETHLATGVMDLVDGHPYTVEDLSRFVKTEGELALSLNSFGFQADNQVTFYADIDGTSRTVDVNTFGCQSMLTPNYCEVHSKAGFVLKLLADGAGKTDYPVNYSITIHKPTTIYKLLHGLKLSEADSRLITKYSLTNLISTGTVLQHQRFPVERNIVSQYWNATKTAAAGANPTIGATITVEPGYYYVLDSIQVEGYGWDGAAIVTDNVIRVQRDLDKRYLELNCYALPPWIDEDQHPSHTVTGTIQLGYPKQLFVPFVDKMVVQLINDSLVDYNFRVNYTYSKYHLGIAEKLKWGIGLTPLEREVSEEKDMEDKVVAGLI